MTNEQQILMKTLAGLDDSQITSFSKELLCKNIRQLLVIIAELDLRVTVRPVGSERVVRVESSLPPDPLVVVEKKREVGRAYDRSG